jgi:integrase
VTLAAATLGEEAVHVGEEAVALLRGALEPDVLAELGWDSVASVVHRVIEHPSFGLAECEVDGCDGPVQSRERLCTACSHRFMRSTAAGRCSDLEAFKKIRRPPPIKGSQKTCAVCCVAPDHLRPVDGQGLCSAHNNRRRRLGLTVAEFVALPGVVALTTFGACKREGCRRLAEGRLGLCKPCKNVWLSRGRPEMREFCADPHGDDVRGEREIVAPTSLAGLPEQVRLELLFVAQRFSLQRRKRSRKAWCRLVRDAREARVRSLLALDPGGANKEMVLARRVAQRELEVLYADPETEFAGEVWDLRKVGLAVEGSTQVLDFSTITQDWLRDAMKGWARCRGSLGQGTVAGVLRAVLLLSESLAQREDGGRVKSALARADVRVFVERVGRLHRAHRVADSTYYRSAAAVRQFLRESRDFGLYEPGAPLHELSAAFAVWAQDLPRAPRNTDGEGRALPQVVMDQLLCDAFLDRLRRRYGEDMFVMLRLLADTGRRPDELARLIATCLDRTEFVDEQTGELESAWVLVHDMPKVGVKDYRLVIAESTARLIVEQRERVVARYPATPLSKLRLFPRERLNTHGTKPLPKGRLSWAVREWVRGLPELVGPSGEAFPRERVFPYAFRHSFAQRHADNGTPIDVLAAMMGHRNIDTTRGYYKVNKTRMRKAVARVSEMQLNHRGHRVTTNLAELVDAEYDRYQVGQIAVAFGTCHEPSNVKSSGQSCPYRFRCFGCAHFRTDPSYLPELREHLQRLLVEHERLNTATDGMLEDWARRDALPAPEEIVAVRRLIRAAEAMLNGLTPQERASIDELFAVIRRARANIDTALPRQLSGAVRQPRPTLYPQPTSGAAG